MEDMLTMTTETWMNGRGSGGRQPDHNYSGGGHGDSSLEAPPRSSLGQLIERSISAPPSSDLQGQPFSHNVMTMMQDNLWSSAAASPMPAMSATSSSTANTTMGYESQSATPVMQNGRGSLEGGAPGGLDYESPFGSNHTNTTATTTGNTLLIQETMDKSGRATAPSTLWDGTPNHSDMVLGQALAANGGRRSAEPPSSRPSLLGLDEVGAEDGSSDHYLQGGSLLAESLGLGLQRSRSAAPSFGSGGGGGSSSAATLGPPPGLSRFGESPIPRPSSVGGIMDNAANVMSSYGGNLMPRGTTGGVGASGNGAVRPAAKTLMDLIQEDMPAEEQAAKASPLNQAPLPPTSPPQPFFGNGVGPPSQRPTQPLQRQPPMQSMANMYVPSQSPYLTMSPQHQQSTPQPPQNFNANVDNLNYGMHNLGIQSQNNGKPVFMERPLVQQQQQQQLLPQQQRYMQTGYENVDEPYGLNASSVQMRQQTQQVVQLQQQPQQQERLYYHQAAQPTPQPQPGLEVQASRLQAQILPNGQTVYIQSPSPPAQNMGYQSTMSFAPAGAPAAPTQIYQRSDGQYVSVVPVHPSPSQSMTFWQADGTQGQAVIMTGSTGTPVSAPAVPRGLLSPTRETAAPGHGGGRHGKGGGRRGRNDRHSGRRGGDGKVSTGVCSPLLDEFRSNKNRQWTIAHIEGHVVEFCQDQNGSRFIQQRLEMGDLREQDIVMREVLPAIKRLRNDVFGNYVVQKLLDFGTSDVRASIRDTLEGEMMQLSLQMYGCRVVQKSIETLSEEDLSRLLREFHHNVLSCIYDQNGNHVIQKCIEVMNTRSKRAHSQGDEQHAISLKHQIDFIINDILVNAASLSCHPYGCRVLQRILEHCDDRTKHDILDQVQPSHKRLLDDQYGNYVIQHVLQFGRTSDRDSILQIVIDTGLLGLSRQKFASNVVEKLLKYGNSSHRRAIAAEMLHLSNDMTIANQSETGTSIVLLMVRDAYANYVVQTTLDVVPESDEKRALIRELEAHSDELKNYTFAKHIVSKLATLTV